MRLLLTIFTLLSAAFEAGAILAVMLAVVALSLGPRNTIQLTYKLFVLVTLWGAAAIIAAAYVKQLVML